MGSQEYAKHETISLKGHPVFTEAWLRDKIVGDPAILGLGDLDVVGVEKPQFQGGRLDLVLKDDAQDRLYEVELMLGKLDESHIIRAIEYWDNEQKRYRDYKHCAVIVAEDVLVQREMESCRFR